MSQPIFILGCPRSGTSLLSRMLDSHSSICVPFETSLYQTFWPWRNFYGALDDDASKRAFIEDFADLWTAKGQKIDVEAACREVRGNGFGAVVDGIMSSLAEAEGKRRWGEKTPHHIRYFDEILADFPDARFIHIYRDGRDCALSWKRARFGPKHLYVAARRWQGYLEMMRELAVRLEPDQFTEIPYEALLQDPERSLRALCTFLDEPFEPTMLDYHQRRRSYPTDRINETNLNAPLLRGNHGKWRETLTADEIRCVESAAGDGLRTYGYELTTDARPVGKVRRVFINRVAHPMLRALSMARNAYGHRLAMLQMLVYVRLRLRAFVR